MAQREFGIPKVLEPEYLASPWLDELSGMTYLSYFMKPGGPGYNATMRWVNTQIKAPVSNFTVILDWFNVIEPSDSFVSNFRLIGTMAASSVKSSKDLVAALPIQRN